MSQRLQSSSPKPSTYSFPYSLTLNLGIPGPEPPHLFFNARFCVVFVVCLVVPSLDGSEAFTNWIG